MEGKHDAFWSNWGPQQRHNFPFCSAPCLLQRVSILFTILLHFLFPSATNTFFFLCVLVFACNFSYIWQGGIKKMVSFHGDYTVSLSLSNRNSWCPGVNVCYLRWYNAADPILVETLFGDWSGILVLAVEGIICRVRLALQSCKQCRIWGKWCYHVSESPLYV